MFNKRFPFCMGWAMPLSVFLVFTGFGVQRSCAQVKHIVLISIDGLHPDMYLDAAWPTPNLKLLMKSGTYADHAKSVFPAYTYPAHVAMITGALPARSGIAFNQPKYSNGDWYWFSKAIKAPTLWQVLSANGKFTAAVEWPCSVGAEITWNLPEIWNDQDPEDRITEARKYATPGLIEDIESHATGKLDANSMRETYFSLDEQAGRAAAYIFKTHQPAFMAVHFACVDGEEHAYGRDADSVRLAAASADRAIGDILEAIERSGLKNSTAVIIIGDHGFSTLHTAFRPNMLIRNLPATFITAGGSAFLYRKGNVGPQAIPSIIKSVVKQLDSLPKDKRKLFRIIYRQELDKMGADSAAILALAAIPGIIFSGSVAQGNPANHGPGTSLRQNTNDGLFFPVTGGHHGYDPAFPDMYTGFIASGPGIIRGGHIKEIKLTDIAPLVARLLGFEFKTPDGSLPTGITQLNK